MAGDIDAVFTLEDYDAQTVRLEFAANLQGCSREEIVELIRAREDERQRIAEEIFGPCAD